MVRESLDSWAHGGALTRLDQGGQRRLPSVGENKGTAERIDGAVVQLLKGSGMGSVVPGRAIIYDPPQLAMPESPDLIPVWSTVLGIVGEPSILRFDDNGLLLWLNTMGADPRAMLLDPADGSERWITDDLAAIEGVEGREEK